MPNFWEWGGRMRLLLIYRQYSPSKAPQRTDFLSRLATRNSGNNSFFDYKRPLVSGQ